MQITIGAIDITIIVIYLVFIVSLGCWVGWRQRRDTKGSGYFLAGRSLTWPVIGLALFSTNISTSAWEHLDLQTLFQFLQVLVREHIVGNHQRLDLQIG